MKQFVPLPLRMREAMAPHHRRIQGAIAMIAHSNMGIRLDGDPQGALRYEGGVYVNGHQIVIKDCFVSGDSQAEQEEAAVADAINMLSEAWKSDGEAILDRFPSVRMGDPLRRLLALQEEAETV